MEQKKNKDAKISSREHRTLFILLGLVAAFGFTLGTVEKVNAENGVLALNGGLSRDFLDPEETPGFKLPPPVRQPDVIDIVDDNVDLPETPVVIPEGDNESFVIAPMPEADE